MVRSLLVGGSGWLAVVVAVNAVIGLAYYVRVAASLYPSAGSPASTGSLTKVRVPWPVAAALAAATVVTVVLGFAPQLVLDAAGW